MFCEKQTGQVSGYTGTPYSLIHLQKFSELNSGLVVGEQIPDIYNVKFLTDKSTVKFIEKMPKVE